MCTYIKTCKESIAKLCVRPSECAHTRTRVKLSTRLLRSGGTRKSVCSWEDGWVAPLLAMYQCFCATRLVRVFNLKWPRFVVPQKLVNFHVQALIAPEDSALFSAWQPPIAEGLRRPDVTRCKRCRPSRAVPSQVFPPLYNFSKEIRCYN